MKVSRLAFAAWVVVVVSATVPACGPGGPSYGPADNPTTVRDVSGVVFGWDCQSNGCEVASLPETPAPDPCGGSDRAGYSYTWGRFFDICSVCVASDGSGIWGTTPGQCRLLACDTSADCPLIYAHAPIDIYECVNGLCENTNQTRRPRTPLIRVDAQDLCFAVYPRSETNRLSLPVPMQVEAELDAACIGSDPLDTCTLPTDCRAP